jgi:hypothetical protein
VTRRASGLGSLLLLAATATPVIAQSGGPPLSPRNASYSIDVRLRHEERMLEGRQIVTWRNLRDRPTRELWLHLYWNAWRNDRSTWMVEDTLRGRSSNQAPRDGDWSWIEIDGAELLPGAGWDAAELGSTLRFASPDDENRHDRTVAVLTLPRAVGPGEPVRVAMSWRAKIPRTFARTGFRGDFYFIAHWFPALGVFEGDGWNCHQFHSATEFFSDYGVYDVSITAPERFVVGATGERTDQRVNGDGTVTHRFEQADVHTFTWTASPDFRTATDRFTVEGLPPVDITLLYQPEHQRQVGRHLNATKAALEHYGRWFGPYPYGHVTVVDPAWGSGAGGMEYPTLFTAGTRWLNPFGGGSPEGVTIHEAGHQFWYGIVGNNEFEHAWIDEGINSFADARVYDLTYGDARTVKRYFSPPGTGSDGFLPLLFDDLREGRDVFGNGMSRFRAFATTDVMSQPTFEYFPSTASHLSYTKTALWLATLERHLGWETLQRILSTYFERSRFGHPTPGEFFALVDESSGHSMVGFFDQVYRGSNDFDYAIESARSEPLDLEGLVEGPAGLSLRRRGDEALGATPTYRSEVVARRHGAGVFPVELLLVFEDGSELRRPWDGRSRWTMIVEERPSRLAWAEIDPQRILQLDIDRTNNSYTLSPRDRFIATKLSGRWIAWLQDLLMTFTFFS